MEYSFLYTNLTWNCHVEQISAGRALTGVGVEVQEYGPKDSEEYAPRMVVAMVGVQR